MNTSQLLKYLSICIDLEKDKYTQEKTIKQLNSNILSLCSEYKNNEVLNKETTFQNSVINSDNVNVDKSGKGCMYFMIYYVGCIGSGLGVLVYNITKIKFTAIIIGIIGAIIGGCIPLIIWKFIIMKKRRKQAIINMQNGMKADNELMESRKARNKELYIIVPKLENEKKEMTKTYELTCQTLKKYYEKNIIPVKYRSIVPICMFYDYILNGRTYSLKKNPQTFDEGAINMYEDECFRNIILNKLDVIIEGLDRISKNQKVLYDAIQEGNRKTHKLLNEINSNISGVNKNLKTIQYQNEQRNKCVEYLSFIAYQNYMS